MNFHLKVNILLLVIREHPATVRGKKRTNFPAGEGKKERNFGRSGGGRSCGKGHLGEGRPWGRAALGKGGPGEGRSWVSLGGGVSGGSPVGQRWVSGTPLPFFPPFNPSPLSLDPSPFRPPSLSFSLKKEKNKKEKKACGFKGRFKGG